jgi:hypothetical protein
MTVFLDTAYFLLLTQIHVEGHKGWPSSHWQPPPTPATSLATAHILLQTHQDQPSYCFQPLIALAGSRFVKQLHKVWNTAQDVPILTKQSSCLIYIPSESPGIAFVLNALVLGGKGEAEEGGEGANLSLYSQWHTMVFQALLPLSSCLYPKITLRWGSSLANLGQESKLGAHKVGRRGY